MKKDWYSPGSFFREDISPTFSRDQVAWILEHYSVLSEGRWPQKSSGYIDNPFVSNVKGSYKPGAYFLNPMEVIAEIDTRIDKCGFDGEVFYCINCLGWEKDRVRRLMRIRDWQLDIKLSQVFSYIAGRRKYRQYTDFVRQKKRDFYS